MLFSQNSVNRKLEPNVRKQQQASCFWACARALHFGSADAASAEPRFPNEGIPIFKTPATYLPLLPLEIGKG
jgi:hypothetical protein